MYIVLLKFSDNKQQAVEFMQGHKDWIKAGVDAGVFMLVGSLKPTISSSIGGGGLLAHNCSLEELQKRVSQDPFVEKNIVSAEVLELSPNQTDERLGFLLS
jgi:uncharacterized protein YciI